MSWHALILLAFHAVLAPATVVHALIHKRDPRSAFGWIAFCTITPVAGPVLYLFFGVNRSRSRAQRFSLSLLRMGERGLDEIGRASCRGSERVTALAGR